MNAIEVRNLCKRRGDFALDDVSFTLPGGTVLGLVGENGAGKTTTIQLIMNALAADSGTVTLWGVSNQDPEFLGVQQEIGVTTDESCFPETLSIRELGRVLALTYSGWDDEAFRDDLRRFHLSGEAVIGTLSRGMKQKLSLAAALAHHPRLLLLDEPTGGLDPMAREELLDVLREFVCDEDHSILLSSHIISDLEKICDYIVFLHQGKLVLREEKDVLMEKYALLKLSPEEFGALPPEAVLRRRETPYCVEALVLKDEINPAFTPEHTTLEDIILFMAKEAQ